LGDRTLFVDVGAQRPELLAGAALLGLWASLVGAPSRGRTAGAALCAFLLPAFHPVTFLAAFGIVPFAGWLAWRGSLDRVRATAVMAGMALGFVALGLWFGLQPDVWNQFRHHAAANDPYGIGLPFFRSLVQFYLPLSAGFPLWFGALAWAGIAVRRGMRKPAAARSRERLIGAGLLFVAFLCHQKFNNTYYISIYTPLAVVFAVDGAVFFLRGRRRWHARSPRLACIVVLVLAVHGAFWVTRAQKYLSDGCPNIRAELEAILASQPSDRRLLVPESFWEAALALRPDVLMNTLPRSSSAEERRDYEAGVLATLRPGDRVLADSVQSFPHLGYLEGPGWKRLETYRHLPPGRVRWGYDVTVWEKTE
ncbi:MAG TPA: hypothetical protein VIM58_06360, partial [Candidatus Methylacidiphilales bacterium]